MLSVRAADAMTLLVIYQGAELIILCRTLKITVKLIYQQQSELVGAAE